MMKTLKLSLILMMCTGILSCGKEDDSTPLEPCDKPAIEDQSRFNGTQTNHYTISTARIYQDCLEVEIRSGGCDGNSWNMELIDSGTVVDSDQVQRYLRISLENDELCEVLVSSKISFNLTPLRRDGKPISFQLEGWDTPLVYEYQQDRDLQS